MNRIRLAHTATLASVVAVTVALAQPKSALEFYDTTGANPTSRLGWTDADGGKFFLQAPVGTDVLTANPDSVSVPGRLNAGSFSGDGSELSGVRTRAADVVGLSDSLETRAPASHTHDAADISNPTGGNYRNMTPAHGYYLRGTWSAPQSITLTAPSDGHAIVFVSGKAHFYNRSSLTDGPVEANFEITHNSTSGPSAYYRVHLKEFSDMDHFSLHKGFPVSAGSNRFYLVHRCKEPAKSSYAMVEDLMFSVIFFPTKM